MKAMNMKAMNMNLFTYNAAKKAPPREGYCNIIVILLQYLNIIIAIQQHNNSRSLNRAIQQYWPQSDNIIVVPIPGCINLTKLSMARSLS
jgi:hypothetical protein